MRGLDEIPIRAVGAIVPAQIAVGEKRRQLLLTEHRAIPAALDVTLLIDTGATRSWINHPYMAKLGLEAVTWKDTRVVNGTKENIPGYEVTLILGGLGKATCRRFPIVIMADDFSGEPHDGLLGRDVLQHLHIAWNGPGAIVHLQYA